MISRRSFLGKAAAAGGAVVATSSGYAESSQRNGGAAGSGFADVLRMPDSAVAFSGIEKPLPLTAASGGFRAADIAVELQHEGGGLTVRIGAPATELTHVRLRWLEPVDTAMLLLGDDWERSYGDLAWRCITPERAMPWYFATYHGAVTHAYGVKTGAAAMCFWQADPEGLTLWLDVSNGGSGVRLGERTLRAATVISRAGHADESPLEALHAFCSMLCDKPRLPQDAVYGVNDWYSAYGRNNETMLLGMADLAADLAPPAGVRPYAVVDMGWKDGSPEFPSMAAYAQKVKAKGVRPGIWIRPLEAEKGTSASLLLPDARYGSRRERSHELAFDPTVPEGMERVLAKMRQLAEWKFELVKHDFSTYDLLGQWGFEMGAQPAIPGWHPHDRSRTNAEIMLDLYRQIRATLGDEIAIIGCNTVGHLGAGVFELQRTGDDTSGRVWERTRRMGVNTLAYRLPQHGTFFHMDPDCVGVTKQVPWELNRQWLDVVASSHTALFISPEEGQVGAEQRRALRDAFAEVTSGHSAALPADLLHDTTPELWKRGSDEKRYRWCAADGASPFTV